MKTIIILMVILNLILAGVYIAGIKINLSPSFPEGFYNFNTIKQPLIKYKNNYILVCLDIANPVVIYAKDNDFLKSGWGCPGNIAPILKKIVGIPGDIITVNEGKVSVNKVVLKNSYIKYDNLQLIIHNGFHLKLRQNEFWIMSDFNSSSFDSRYFGVVKESAIKKTGQPFLLF